MLRTLGSLAALKLMMFVAVSFMGRFLALGDSLAVFRIPLLLCLFLLAILSKHTKIRIMAAALITACLVVDISHRHRPSAPTIGDYRIYQKNISFRIKDIQPLASDIIKSRADFVTLQEVVKRNQHIKKLLSSDYPHQHHCPFVTIVGPAVLSRHPFVKNSQTCAHGLAAVKVSTPKGQIWIVSLHLRWPWPYGQAEQIKDIENVLNGFDAPVLLAGDFNAVPWSSAVQTISHKINAQRTGQINPTFNLPFMGITIDHILAEHKNFKTELRPKFGSDHNGIIADVNPAKP